MTSFAQALPPPDEMLRLQPEDLAPMLLAYLQQFTQEFNRYNVFIQSGDLGTYAGAKYASVADAMQEAWMVLEREGMVAPKASDYYGHQFFITRRGRGIQNRADFGSYALGNLLPIAALEPVLAEKVRTIFLGGDYDTAVFRAMRELEVAVRRAARLDGELVGVPLMRAAFNLNNGPLTDQSLPMGEREATQHLFAGVIGTFKNPSSHRDVSYLPREAASVILFASFLLSWVGRMPQKGPE